MNKKLSILTILSLGFGLTLSAQSSMTKHDASGIVYGNDTTLQHANVKIVNTGSSTIDIKVSMDNFSANPNHVSYFCWGIICYPPTTFVSTDPVTLSPGDTNTSFIGYLHPSGVAAVSQVTYNFFNIADESDSVSATFIYDFTTGVDELKNKVNISDAYPNPANNLTRISYDLSTSGNSRLVFYNLLGSIVYETPLTDNKGTLIVNTSGMKSGIYYYSIVTAGKNISSKKLVIAHR
ncbi:MAG TPA: T9SS type A sorting domain-containing protein [Bacteroidia bacterium]|nr:T9SS type A sorting domain-containing protein [Bacteroidia bacterium]